MLVLGLAWYSAAAQGEMMKIAADHVSKGNYMAAYNIYQRIAEKDSMNAEANFGTGVCILYMTMSKKAAVKYLERSLRAGIKDPEAMYFMGMAYHHNLMYELADAAFQEYLVAKTGVFLADAARNLRHVENAKKICQAPVSVIFKNIGPNINSEYPDYYPMITPDESMLAFTTRRKSNVSARLEFDGFYPSDIWVSRVADGEYKLAENAGRGVNSAFDEQLVGLSVDGNQLYVYSDNIKEFGNIYYSNYSAPQFSKKVMFDQVINSEHFESAATISADQNTLFFASDRPGGFGGKDLYMTRKLPTGTWAAPQNLGSQINTMYDEDFPYLFHDGQSLYFASQGHSSIGGFDIFKSTWNSESNTWTNPVNIGYPVNTIDDNMTISFTRDQLHAYISCYRSDSKGDLDIYMVTFLDKDPRRTIYKSKIVRENSQQIVKRAMVTVVDTQTEEEIGIYYPDPSSGSLIMALQPGAYQVTIDADGYKVQKYDIVVKGKSDFKDFQLQDFILSPL